MGHSAYGFITTISGMSISKCLNQPLISCQVALLNRNLRILELWKPIHKQIGWSNSNQGQMNVVFRMKNDPKEKLCPQLSTCSGDTPCSQKHLPPRKKFISSSFTSMIRDNHHLFKTFTRNSSRALGFPLFRNLFSEMTIGDKRKETRCRWISPFSEPLSVFAVRVQRPQDWDWGSN